MQAQKLVSLKFKLTTTQFRKEMLTLLIELTRQLRNNFGIVFFNNYQHSQAFSFSTINIHK